MAHGEQTPAEVFTRIPQDGFFDKTNTRIYDSIARVTEGLYSDIEREASGAEAAPAEEEMAAFLGALPLEQATYGVVRDGKMHAALHTRLLLPFMSGYPLVMDPLYLPEVELSTTVEIDAVVPGARFEYTDGPTSRQQQEPENAELSRELWAASYTLNDERVREIRRELFAQTKDYAPHEQRATILGVAGTPVPRSRILGMFKRPVYDYTTPEKTAELKAALAGQLRGAEDVAVTAHVRATAILWGLHGYDALALKTAPDRTDTPVTPSERVPMTLRALGAMVARSQS